MLRLILSFPHLFTIAAVVGALVGTPHRCVAQVAAPEVAVPTVSPSVRGIPGTPRQQQWLNATIDQRVRLAEQLGEEGGRAYAKSKGWEPIMDGTKRGIPQGIDQVYRGSNGLIHAIEAKGGTSQLGHAYGHPQGSSEWAVESAKRVLRSPNATAAEKAGAEAVLQAAAKRKLCVHVIRTSHVLGEPTAAVLQQSVQTSGAASNLAKTAVDGMGKMVAESGDEIARAAKGSGTITKTVTKGAVVVGVVVDAGFRVNEGIATERRFESGEISVQQREVAHAKNLAGMAGGWGGAVAGAKLGAVGGGAAGSCVAPGPGTAVGGVAGGVAGGIVGYVGGEAAAESAAEWTVNAVHATGTTIGKTAQSAWSATSNAAQSAGNAWSWATNW